MLRRRLGPPEQAIPPHSGGPMKHETKLYQGKEAVTYARRNEGAFLRLTKRPVIKERWPENSYNTDFNAEKINEILGEYGPEVFSIRGGTSDEHDETFFLWPIHEHDHLRSRMFSTDFTGSYTPRLDDESHDEIGVDLSFIHTDSFSDVGSVTLRVYRVAALARRQTKS